MLKQLPDSIDAGLVRRVLATRLRHHGHVLMALPVFIVFNRALPAAAIDPPLHEPIGVAGAASSPS